MMSPSEATAVRRLIAATYDLHRVARDSTRPDNVSPEDWGQKLATALTTADHANQLLSRDDIT